MSSRTVATQYARALLDVARQESDPRQVEQELTAFVDLFESHSTLRKVLVNPAVPTARKRALVSALAARAGLSPVVSRLLGLLAERDRLAVLPDLAAAYRERLLEQLNVVRAEVITAAPLSAGRASELERGLAAVTGRRVTIEARVDPSIIGGVVARVGSTVYDGSIKRQLERMQERLRESR